ncbi:MAG: hypothetical protein U0174_07865 [Polyangiaceae bacterium]
MKESLPPFKRLLTVFFGVAAIALPVATALSTLATPGCYDRGCDQKGLNSPQVKGNLLDPNTWESGPMEADWLDFGAGQTWVFDTSSLGPRQPTRITGYISAQKKSVVINPDGVPTPRAFTPAGGNVFEVQSADANIVVVHNTTCAQYYVRVVIESDGPLPDAGPLLDAGDASADARDASDATTD